MPKLFYLDSHQMNCSSYYVQMMGYIFCLIAEQKLQNISNEEASIFIKTVI